MVCSFIQPVHCISEHLTPFLIETDRKAPDRIVQRDNSVKLMGDNSSLGSQLVDFLPASLTFLLAFRNLILTDSLDTFLVFADHALHKGHIGKSRFQHTVRIFELVCLCTQGFNLGIIPVDLVRLIGDLLIKRVNTALMILRLSIQKRK